jgi:hypothetical protein
MVHTFQNLKTSKLTLDLEFHQHLGSLKHVINIIIWIRDIGCYSARLCRRGELLLQGVPDLPGGPGAVLKNFLGHRREETTQQLLILIIPMFIRRVGNLFSTSGRGGGHSFLRCDLGSI